MCISEGKKLYIQCIRSAKYVADVEKMIKEEEDSLEKLATSYEKSSQVVTNFDKEVNKAMDKISTHQREKDSLIEIWRVKELDYSQAWSIIERSRVMITPNSLMQNLDLQI